jgi:hypothetical protein
MYLDKKTKASSTLLFDVPHKLEPMTIKQIMKKFPEFAKTMDGSCDENSLLFYYKKNKDTGCYEFQDDDAQEDIAELLGVKIKSFELKDEEEVTVDALTNEQIETHKENIEMIRDGLKQLDTM